jgi:hypothetical protein
MEQILHTAESLGSPHVPIEIKPGPIFGKILNEPYELQLDGKLKTREEAVAHLREILRRYNIPAA